MTKLETVGICGMSVCGVVSLVGTVFISPFFLAFIPIACIVGNTCNLRGKKPKN